MKRYNLLVKGNAKVTLEATSNHIPNVRVLEHNTRSRHDIPLTTVIVEIEEKDELVVYKWFGEAAIPVERYGYPDGTLVHFRGEQAVISGPCPVTRGPHECDCGETWNNV